MAGQALAMTGGGVSLAPLRPLPDAGERVVNHRMTGIALNGFDPVGYFERLKPVPGKPEHEVLHAGATWRFATLANLEAFLAMPEAYMPLFGGHDAWAVAAGRAVAGLPQHFTISRGHLLVFSSADARAAFLAEPGMLDAATGNWPSVERQLAR